MVFITATGSGTKENLCSLMMRTYINEVTFEISLEFAQKTRTAPTCDSGHRTWRNQGDIDQEASSLLDSFHRLEIAV